MEGREAYLFDSKCLHPLTLVMYNMHVTHAIIVMISLAIDVWCGGELFSYECNHEGG